jgi:ribosomal protein L29
MAERAESRHQELVPRPSEVERLRRQLAEVARILTDAEVDQDWQAVSTAREIASA